MDLRVLSSIAFRAVLMLCAVGVSCAATLDAALSRMDQNAAVFKSMTAKIRQLAHIGVLNEDNVSMGTIRMRRSKRDAQILVEFTEPDPKAFAFSGTKIELYYPKIQTVEEYDVGKKRDMVEKFLALGFGASSKELQGDYTLRDLGEEPVDGEKANHVELIPKSKEVAQSVPKIELWLSQATAYPVQQKLHQGGGDYNLITYSDVKINPSLPDSAFKLNLARGVKRVFPGK